ncbi:uncharacterized protein [Henckelia pumila]|uniref:uncharacterized protein n=1 Tax=Henckelia pumila TaxID=405737 RepID=UPI003C6DBDFC
MGNLWSSLFSVQQVPQMKNNQITHFSHPDHPLRFDPTESPFKCDGCKEVGIGSRYRCAACDYDLHSHCAVPTAAISHPFYTKCSFQFLSRPPGTVARYCNACEKDVAGFLYHCKSCDFDLHPCCAKLPMLLDDGELKLFLYKKVSSPCNRCGRKGRSWSYRSSCKKYNLHVACVKEMLMDSWHEIYDGGAGSRIPNIKATLQPQNPKPGKGKVSKSCEMAALALQFVISALLGDPTTIIAGLVASFMSK